MRAMILAAGLGTRLRPLTNDRPKALVEINGRTLLELALTRLRRFGIREVIVNVHHFADMIVGYLKANNNFGMRVEISREPELLDTGGGLRNAAHFFLESNSNEAFVVHNVDVLSSIDLERMVEFHCANQALATLAVQQRQTSRQLLFDARLQLCGQRSGDDEPELARPAPNLQALAFCGIHVISPGIFQLMSEQGAFPIIPTYLRLAAQRETIAGFRADEYYWRDVGTPQKLKQAERDVQRGVVPI